MDEAIMFGHEDEPLEEQGEGIENPWHSRPIDVHRWSDHPEFIAIADQIWEEHFPEEKAVGPNPKTPHRHQLRVLILDLYVAWKEDPKLCIGVSMSSNYWDTNSRYNAIHISKKIIEIIRKLSEVGLLNLSRGSYSGPKGLGNRTTRIRASAKLQERFRSAKAGRDDIVRARSEEIIILRGADERLVEYEDTEQTELWREELRQYNEVIARAF
ncbi:hypothetical protein [Celeribacter persicus]|uniref:Uncharacterized protein n=1 Tax=Celeribacter persicus TaxID=1651082 RepID=A0A2T5GG12_9RHOB|nr:hypothetical protein [Celeribacter persicus]PTQ58257.1 hypothetical protein C8N42_1891 [Celeribacter persicus]